MIHTCKALIIHCMDFRLMKPIYEYLEKQNLVGDCDQVVVAGAVKAIAENPDSPEAAILLKQIRLSRDLHGMQTLILMHHTDCGAYGGHAAFDSPEEERDAHISAMRKTRDEVNKRIPGLEIRLVLADMQEGEKVEFQAIN